jgi:endonuclease/exonuclease/phosphatase family metal-dependent hydrolase
MKLLTYNVQMRPLPFQRNRPRSAKLRALLTPAKYDIICLQELFCSRHPLLTGNTDADRTRLLPDMFAAFSPKPKSVLRACDSGLAIFSRRKILFSRFAPFSRSAGADRLCEKGVLYACIRISKYKHFHVFNTQLQSGRGKQAKLIRAAQLEEAYAFIGSIAGNDNAAIVLAGDFNHSLTNVQMFRTSSIYSGRQLTCGKKSFDYICVQDNLRLGGNIDTKPMENLSDHHAVEFAVTYLQTRNVRPNGGTVTG